ncbi:hypothetical protein [Streptomyces aidingensis]|nr:hypothetical protein [Streptomyces aidingensis]
MLLGDQLDLDHDDDGDGYLGWAHASCNRSAGATKGNRARAAAYQAARWLSVARPGREVVRPLGLDSSAWSDADLLKRPPIPDDLLGPERRGYLVWSEAMGCWSVCSRIW